MKPLQNHSRRGLAVIGILALTMGSVACGAPSTDGSTPEEEEAPDASVTEQALAAQAAAQATVVSTAIVAPFVNAGTSKGLLAKVDVDASIEAAIASLQAHLGACVTATPNVGQGQGSIALEFKDCTSSFEALTFSGSGTAELTLSASNQLALTLTHDLVIVTATGELTAAANMSAELGILAASAGVDATISVALENGVMATHSGKLDIKIAGLCVDATLAADAMLAADSSALNAHLQVSGMAFCANGPACVAGVELVGIKGKVELSASGGVSFGSQGSGNQLEAGVNLDAKFGLELGLGTADSCTPGDGPGDQTPPATGCTPSLE